MSEQKEWEQKVRDVFAKVKSHKKRYSIEVDGVKVCIYPNVFSPAYFTDSKWFVKTVPKIVGQRRFLEIGTGTGIVALFVGLNGADVSATDINPAAVKNAKYNFEKYGINVKTYCGDMYEPLPRDAKFDVIFWNHPFNRGENQEEMLLKSGFDFEYSSIERYITHAHSYLNPNGRLLLGTSNFALLSEIEQLANKNGYTMVLLEKAKIPLAADSSIDNEYRIYEFVKIP